MNTKDPAQSWQRLVDEKAFELHEQIAATLDWVKQHGGSDASLFSSMTAQPYEWLRELYAHELPLAKLMDEADLIVELKGPDVEVTYPRISLVSSTFEKVKKNVLQVTKAIAGVAQPESQKPFHLPESMELGFASLACNGALRFGFALPEPDDQLLKKNDPLYVAVSRAVLAIRSVSISLSDLEDEAQIEKHVKESLTDPKLRDSAMLAVRDLSPSRQKKGINSVAIAGGDLQIHDSKPLTTESRKTLRHILAVPVRAREVLTVVGTVREADLDKDRFEVRGIREGNIITDMRCVYGKNVSDSHATEWLNKRVEVTGRVERDLQGRPRLMQVKSLRLLDAQEKSQQLVFEFPDVGA